MTLACMATLPSSIIVQSAHSYTSADEQRDVFESHRHHIFSVAYYMTGDEREAETILSSTFVQTFQEHSKPSIDLLDKSLMGQLRERLSLDPVPAAEAGSAGLSGRNIRRTDLEEALWRLPARERLCFLLNDVEGYSSSRIAGLLDTSDADVQRTVLSGRIRIRQMLVEQRESAIA